MNDRFSWLRAALLVVFVWMVYAFAFPGIFHMDDWEYITHNPLITRPHGLASIWFSTQPKDYYPLTYTVFWIEWRLWAGHAAGYLAVNIALHAVNVVLLWQVLRRLQVPGAWLAALLFALHPLNVVAVAWLSELKTMLAMLFSLLTVLVYSSADVSAEALAKVEASAQSDNSLTSRGAGQALCYPAALGLFALALLSKSAVVTLPVVLLLIAAWRQRRFRMADFIRSIPFFALSVIFGSITIWFQSHHVLEGGPDRHLNFFQRAGEAACALWFYLGKACFPFNLMLIYPNWVKAHSILIEALAATGWVGLAALLWRYKQWGVLTALGIYAALLLPVLGFIDQGFYAFALVSDHWQYFGLAAVLVLPADLIIENLTSPQTTRHTVAMIGAAVILGVLPPLTAWRASLFSSAERLWRDSLARNPNNWVAHFNLGLAEKQQGKLDAAIANYAMALDENPSDIKTCNNLGSALMKRGNVKEALPYFQEAVRLKPDLAIAHNNLGIAFASLEHLDEAVSEFREAVRLEPHSDEFQANLAKAQALIARRGPAPAR